MPDAVVVKTVVTVMAASVSCRQRIREKGEASHRERESNGASR